MSKLTKAGLTTEVLKTIPMAKIDLTFSDAKTIRIALNGSRFNIVEVVGGKYAGKKHGVESAGVVGTITHGKISIEILDGQVIAKGSATVTSDMINFA